jgi:hypothetical protein
MLFIELSRVVYEFRLVNKSFYIRISNLFPSFNVLILLDIQFILLYEYIRFMYNIYVTM